MLDAETAIAFFEEMGRSQEYAIYVLALENYKRDIAIQKQEIDIIEDRYVRHEIDAATAQGRLAGLNLKGAHTQRLMEEWGIKRRAKIALPTRSNIAEFYKDDVITEQTARLELLKRRYPDYAIDWWIRSWDEQIVEIARNEAERAQKEQERIAKAKFRTDRSVALANLNREIAELKLMMAELKLAAYHATTDEQVATIKEALLTAKVAIADLQLQKVELPVVPEERR